MIQYSIRDKLLLKCGTNYYIWSSRLKDKSKNLHWPHFLGYQLDAARHLNSETNPVSSYNRPIFSPSLVKIGPRTHENSPEKVPHP